MEDEIKRQGEENQIVSNENSVPNNQNVMPNKQKVVDFFSKVPKHNWAIATYVFAVLSTVLIIMMLTGTGVTGNVISEGKMEKQIDDFVNNQLLQEGGAEIESLKKESGLYQAMVNYDGEIIPLYFTLDGKFISQGGVLTSISGGDSESSKPQPTEVEKTEVPVFEAFLSPYCPYGLQFEKGLIPVYELLKDSADINIRLMSPTHMQEETPQIKEELCILEEYGADVYFDYLKEVVYDDAAAECYNVYHGVNLQTNEQIDNENVGDGEWFTSCMAPIYEGAMSKVGIEESVVDSCLSSKGDDLYSEATTYAQSLSVGGSPTTILNDVKVSTARSPDAIKETICSGFIDEPTECSQTLGTETFSPGIGVAVSSGTSAGAC